MQTLVRLLLICVVSTGCTSISRLRKAGEEDPATRAAARTIVERRGDYEVRASDGWFRVNVPARLVEEVLPAEGDHFSLALENGSIHPISCVVMRESEDPPYFLQTASRTLLSQAARAAGEIESHEVAGTDVGAVGGAIFMGVEWDILVKTAEGNTPGEVDLLYGIKDGAGVYCAKIDLGFRPEFHAVFAALLENLELADPPEAPVYKDITLVSRDGRPVGLHVETIRIDEEGYKQDEELYHVLSSSGGDRLAAVTRYDYEWVDPKYLSMIHAGMVRVVNGNLVMKVTLEWSNTEKGWIVRGSRDGKDLEARLDDERGPTPILASVRAVRDVLATPDPTQGAVEIRKWDPFDPTQLEKSTLRIVEIVDEAHARASLESPSTRDELIIDRETGLIVSTVENSESVVIETKRIYSAGSP